MPRKLGSRTSSRSAKPKFYLDESVAAWVAEVLRRLHQSVETASHAGLLGRADQEHFAHCWRRGRVLVTHDFDFADYKKAELPDTRNPGVIVLDCDSKDSAEVLRVLSYVPRIADVTAGRGWRHTRTVLGPTGFLRIRRRNRNTGADEIEQYRINTDGLFERVAPSGRRSK